jgi:pimeloyl-ACP methyl ester carboxylesterase
MKLMLIGLCCVLVPLAGGMITALVLVASAEPKGAKPRDVFGFAALARAPQGIGLPELQRYPARDGEQLAYRIYDSPSDKVLIFLHGSSYHGAGYHALATAISSAGAAKVVLPNLRGHYLSGRRRGDVDYIGQYEDDLADLVAELRRHDLNGPITLGGHSSGGGLAIRFAGGTHRALVSSFLVLAPIIPTSAAVRGGNAGGWSILHMRRLYGLLLLNALGIHGYDGLPVIAFNKPEEYWDGTETLSYSYRLNASYYPRFRSAADLQGLGDKALVLVGADDEAVDAEALRGLLAAAAPSARFEALSGVNHFAIFSHATTFQLMSHWLRE